MNKPGSALCPSSPQLWKVNNRISDVFLKKITYLELENILQHER